MHVTSRFTAVKRGEPGRKLLAEKCEAASVYSDFPQVFCQAFGRHEHW
jgi:hypothetical protein